MVWLIYGDDWNLNPDQDRILIEVCRNHVNRGGSVS